MNSLHTSIVCFLVVIFTGGLLVEGKKIKSAEDCEVCVKFVERLDAKITADQRKSIDKIREVIVDDCKNRKGKDERFCYYIGGSSQSATGLLLEVARPLSYHKPALKICQNLSSKDDAICDLKYEKQIDYVNANFKKMKVKELKKILTDWDEQCRGCTEKSDYVARVLELLPEYAPEAAAARAKQEL